MFVCAPSTMQPPSTGIPIDCSAHLLGTYQKYLQPQSTTVKLIQHVPTKLEQHVMGKHSATKKTQTMMGHFISIDNAESECARCKVNLNCCKSEYWELGQDEHCEESHRNTRHIKDSEEHKHMLLQQPEEFEKDQMCTPQLWTELQRGWTVSQNPCLF